MSERDPNHDPIDKAYVEAEALLSDEAARAARRAALLAAVAQDAAAPERAPRRSVWPRGVWLAAAASVAGVGLFLASQPRLTRPFKVQAPPAAAPAVQPSPAAPEASSAPTVQPPAQKATPEPINPETATAPQAFPSGAGSAPARPSARSRALQANVPPPPPVMQREVPAPPEPGPPPPPPISIKPVEKVIVPPPPPKVAPPPPAAPAPAPAPAPAFSSAEATSAGRAATTPSDAAVRLRAAAAAGRTAEVEALLAQGAMVDAPDDAGYTALMRAVQADHPEVAAVLRRRGASLDLKNRDGQSARNLAAVVGDAKLNQALGLAVPGGAVAP